VVHPDYAFLVQIGNGAGNLLNTDVGAHRKAPLVDGGFEQAVGRVVDPAMLFDVTAGHLGVAVDLGAGQSLRLNFTGSLHPFLDVWLKNEHIISYFIHFFEKNIDTIAIFLKLLCLIHNNLHLFRHP
jgi:hypothetical protein